MKIKFNPIFMNHWGIIDLLPSIRISITYNVPTIHFQWLVFRLDVVIYHELPDWFMNSIWSFLNFDFIKRKNKEV